MKPKYFSQIDNGILWYRKLNPDGTSILRGAGMSMNTVHEDKTPGTWTEESLIDLGYLPCTKREATERGKFPM